MDARDERIAELERQIKAMGEQLECDRSLVADCLTKARQAVSSREWLTNGRGCYEWNDDRWHDEFRRAADEFLGALEPVDKVARDWSGCPKSGEEIAQARIDLKQRISELEARVSTLECGIRAYLEGNYPNPGHHRPNKCQHGRNYWDECVQCDCDHFYKLLNPSVASALAQPD